jgi:hypothetical protein
LAALFFALVWGGFSLWVGDDRGEYDVVTENANVGQRFLFAGSGEESQSDDF